MKRTKEDIIDYFQEFIFGFICHDIERCIEARANYVVALALLSYTEFIGGLISGKLGLKDKGIAQANFNKALEYFPDEYRSINSTLKIEYKDENGKTQTDTGIYGVYRCGLVHEYFIKGISTVINYPNGQAETHRIGIEPTPMYILSDNVERELLVLRTNEYFRDFRSAVYKIYKGLVVDCDPKLLSGFNKSLDRIDSRKSYSI